MVASESLVAQAPRVEAPVKWPVVLAVVLTAVLEVLDSTIVNVALPHLQAAFGIAADQTTWILTSYIVAAIVVMPLTGLFARWLGKRRLITISIVGFTVFSALCGIAENIEMMVVCRLGQGLFGAFLIPLSQSTLMNAFPRDRRGQAMAMFGLGVIVAPILGPTLGAVLTEHFSWRAVFYVNVPIAAFALMMISGELQREETQKVAIDWTGLILMVLAIGCLQFVLDQGETRDWLESRVIQVFVTVAALSAVLFVVRGWRLDTNIIDFKLLRDRSFASANLAMIGFGLALYGTIAMLPLFVQGLLGYPVLDAGYLFVPRGIAAAFSMVITGSVLIKRFDPRLLVATGLLLNGAGSLALSWLNLDAGFWQLALPGAISGLGMGLFFVPMSTVAFQNFGPERQDEASGIYSVMRSLGSSVGIAVVGWQLVSSTQRHWHDLAGHVTLFNPAVHDYLRPFGVGPTSSKGAEIVAAQVASQAQMLAFQDVFLITGIAAFIMLPLVFVMQKPHASSGSVVAH